MTDDRDDDRARVQSIRRPWRCSYDVRGLTKAQIGDLVATLTQRMGIDPALAPIDLIADKQTGAIRVYINARGAAESAKRRDLSDDELDIDIREAVVIVKS